ncbi:MAG: hypothetical protein O3A00_25440 [Planctomycetota bacterium]|nr:hypothetical protein [Planctomycetota bacterium]
MAMDPYSICPCGSGKKLKFCCHGIVADMEKVAKLTKKRQVRMARQTLEGLLKTHPRNPWVVISFASILFHEHEHETARHLLADYYEHDPEHRRILALYAMTCLNAAGYADSRRIIARAFQRCARECPEIMTSVGIAIAAMMQGKQEFMAARQFLTVAMKIGTEKDRRDVFIKLLELESNAEIPYPLRSVHQLAVYAGTPEREEEAQKAARLASFGCVTAATQRFERLLESEPENPILWQNVGFCRAWDGESSRAAEALHKASKLHENIGAAVECETIAQLLKFRDTESLQNVRSLEFKVESVSKLLTALDEASRFKRFEIPAGMLDNEDQPPTGAYNIIDREVAEDFQPSADDLESIPKVLAEMTVFDEDAEEELEQRAYITGLEGEGLDEAARLFEEAASGLCELVEDEDDEDSIIESIPADLVPFQWRWHLPTKLSGSIRRSLENSKWNQLLSETWPDTPFEVLDGKTPREASQDPELKVALTSLVYVLDAYCTQNSYAADLNGLANVLGVELLPELELTPDLNLNSLTAMQLHRLPVSQLDNEQITYTLNRALMIRHSSFLFAVLTEAVERDSLSDTERETVYSTLVDICRDRSQRDAAIDWLNRGIQWSESTADSFDRLFQWRLRELRFRLEEPTDPEIPGLMKHIWNYYGPKLPEIREHLATLVEAYGLDQPWDDEAEAVAAAVGVESGSESAGGIWTPEKPAEGSGQSLWVPGQE